MAADLRKVLPGVRAGAGVEHDHGLIDDDSLLIPDQGKALPVGNELIPRADPTDDIEGVRSADADDADAAVTSGGRFGIDGIRFYRDAFLGKMTTFLYTPSPILLVFRPLSFFRARWMIRRS